MNINIYTGADLPSARYIISNSYLIIQVVFYVPRRLRSSSIPHLFFEEVASTWSWSSLRQHNNQLHKSQLFC